MAYLRQVAHAKVNLMLHVTGKRPNTSGTGGSHHWLESLVVFTQLGDVIIVKPRADNAITLSIIGPFAQALEALCPPEENLVMRTAHLLQKHFSITTGADITLEKYLPPSSGIGGGSTDAATTALLLKALWNLPTTTDKLAELLLPFGADIPVCLHHTTCRMAGIGEEIYPLPIRWADTTLLLVNPHTTISTASVFGRGFPQFEKNTLWPEGTTLPDTILGWAAAQRNMLEPNAITEAPIITTVLETLRTKPACRFARMSGSGATCFAVFDDYANAQKAADALRQQHPEWWIHATRLI